MTFVLSDDKNVLTAEIAFASLALFDIIKMPLALLPLLIVYMLEVNLKTFFIENLSYERNIFQK